MSLEEKIGQMTQLDVVTIMKQGSVDEVDPEKLKEYVEKYFIGR